MSGIKILKKKLSPLLLINTFRYISKLGYIDMYKQKKSEGLMCCLLIFIYQYNTTILKHLTCQY